MNILCVMPARGGSKRLPLKNIVPIRGKPMIQYTIKHARAAKHFYRIVVATDSGEIEQAANDVWIYHRPPEISSDTSPIEDTLRWCIQAIEKENEGTTIRMNIIVMLQPNIIYRRTGLIDEVVAKLTDNENLTAVMTVYKANQRPEWMKRIEEDLLIPNMECDKFRQQDLPILYLADGSVVAVRTEVLMDTIGLTGVHRWCGDRIGYVLNDRFPEIDEPEDVPIAEALLRSKE